MKKVGDGTRILNFLIDTGIVFTLSYFAYKWWNWYVLYWGYEPYKFWWFFAGVLVVYYFLFEVLFLRTPAKWFSYTKVVNTAGKRPSVIAIFIRTIVRLTVIDLFFIPFLGKPLHDYLSKTQLVEV
jgi:uncharacterized RDD family membrane protein YckC